MKSNQSEFGKLARMIHWSTFILTAFLIISGFNMIGLTDQVAQADGFKRHIVLGVIVVLITILRIVWRKIDVTPEAPSKLSGLRLIAFNWNHYLLYIVLLTMGISGVSMVLQSGLGDFLFKGVGDTMPVLEETLRPVKVHEIFAYFFSILAIMHIGGVFSYQFTKGNTLKRMGLKKFPGKKD